MKDAWYWIELMVQYVFMLAFINTTYTLKRKRALCELLILVGNIGIVISELENAAVFYTVFTAVNMLLLLVCCRVSVPKALLHGAIISAILAAAELIVVFSDRDMSFPAEYGQDLGFLIKSRIIYGLGLVLFRSLIKEIRVSDTNYSPFNVAVHTMSGVIAVITFDGLLGNRIYVLIYLMLVVINIASFAAWEIIAIRTREMQKVINESEKHYAELESYKLLSEKYESTQIMRHDIKEQLDALRAMIDDGSGEAKRFAGRLEALARELYFTEYTDNRVLNLLLNRKLKECHDKGIELYISSGGAKVGSIPELETVAIFSNLINNAMESCMKSKEKNIFIDFSTLNDAFAAVKIENNCDEPPKLQNGRLMTQKSDGVPHGIGMKSAERAVTGCGGKLSWSYDRERKFFRTVVMFPIRERSEDGL